MRDSDGGAANIDHGKCMELIISMYVDDLIITSMGAEDIDSFKHEMVAHF